MNKEQMLVTDKAIEGFELNQCYAGWFESLFATIKNELDRGRAYQASQLADIGQYLADDLNHNITESLNLLDKQ